MSQLGNGIGAVGATTVAGVVIERERLALTGANTYLALTLGLLLCAGGMLVMFLGRRRA